MRSAMVLLVALACGAVAGAQDLEELLARVEELVREERDEEARALCEQIIGDHPGNARAYYRRAQTYWGTDENERMLADYGHAIQLDPAMVPAYIGRGRVYDRMGEEEPARADFEKAIELCAGLIEAHPGRGEVYYLRGMALFRMNERHASLDDFLEAVRLDPTHAEAHQHLGLNYMMLRRYEDALAAYEGAIRLNPRNVFSLSGRATVCRLMGNYDLALADYDRMLEINPEFISAYLRKAETHAEMGRAEQAAAEYESVLQLRPEAERTVRLSRATTLLFRLNDPLAALSDYDWLIEATTEAPEHYLLARRAWAHSKLGNREPAERDYAWALELASAEDLPGIHASRARSRLQWDDVQGAWDDVHMAERLGGPVETELRAQLEQRMPEIEAYLAEVEELYMQARDDEALPLCEQIVAAYPDSAEAYCARGRARLAAREVELALEDFDRAIELDPESFSTYYQRARVYYDKGDYAAAWADVKKCRELAAEYGWEPPESFIEKLSEKMPEPEDEAGQEE